MADGLSTGIALSGKFDYSTTGLEPVVQAERDMMGRRAEEARQKAKDRAALEDDVRKLTVYKNDLKTPVYQKMLENRATTGIADVIQKLNNGDDDAKAAAYKFQQDFVNFTAKMKSADDEIQTTFKAIAENPDGYAWTDPQIIDGKEYGGMLDVLNDPKFADPEAMKRALQKIGGSDIQIVEGKSPSDPAMIIRWRPGQVADPIEVAIEDAKLRNQYDDYRVGKPFMFGDKRMAETAYGMNPNTVNSIVEESFMKKPVLRAYEELLYKNRPDKAMTRAEFSQTDWMSEAKRMHEQNVRPRIQSMVVNQGKIEDALSAPAQSTAQKNAEKLLSSGSRTNDGKTWMVPVTDAGQKRTIAEFPKGTKYKVGAGKALSAVPANIEMEATPVRVEWNGPGKESFIIYQSKLDPTGSSISEVDETYTYYVPFDRNNLNRLAAIGGSDMDTVLDRILYGADNDVVKEIQDWYSKIGGEGNVSGKPASATPTGNKSKWESAKRK